MRRLLGVAGLAAVLVISGCAAPPPAASSRPTPEATASAEPVVEAAPGSRVPATCDELMPVASVEALIGPDLVDSVWAQDFFTRTTLAQQGVLACDWAADESTGASVIVLIAPDPEYVPPWLTPDDIDQASRDTVTEGSVRRCIGEEGYSHCEVFFPTEDYSVELFVNNGIAPTIDAIAALADRFGVDLVEALSVTEPLSEWVPSERATIDTPDCAPVDPEGAVAAAFPDVDLERAPTSGFSGDGPGILYRAMVIAGHYNCGWFAVYNPSAPVVHFSLSIVFIPGSGWNWDAARREGAAAIDVSGAIDAFSVCHEHGCDAFALVGDTIVRANSQTQSRDALADAITGLRAFIPVLPVEAR